MFKRLSSSAGDGGVLTVGAFGSSPNSGGASISGTVLTLQPASATQPGGVTTGVQTYTGIKTFASQIASTVASGSSFLKALDGARLNLSTADTSAYLYRSTTDTIRTPGTFIVDGMLGVGVAPPLFPLHVVSAAASSLVAGLVAATDASSSAYVGAGGTNGGLAMYGVGSTAAAIQGSTTVFRDYGVLRSPVAALGLGILTGNPTGRIVFAGTSAVNSNITEWGSFASTGNFAVDTNVLLVDAVNDRVGINKTVPTVPLDVVGAMNITGAITSTSTVTLTPSTTGTGGEQSLLVQPTFTPTATASATKTALKAQAQFVTNSVGPINLTSASNAGASGQADVYGGGSVTGMIGTRGSVNIFGAITSTTLVGVAGDITHNTAGAVCTDAIGVRASLVGNPATATIAAYSAFRSETPTTVSAGTITNAYGLYLADNKVTGITNGWGVYQLGASVVNRFEGNVLSAVVSGSAAYTFLLGARLDGGASSAANMLWMSSSSTWRTDATLRGGNVQSGGNNFSGTSDAVLTFTGIISNGAAAVVHAFASTNGMTTVGTKLLSFRNVATEKAFVGKNGQLGFPTGNADSVVGTATLGGGGTVVVNTTAVSATSLIFVSSNTPGGTPGVLSAPVGSIVAATSFVINSSNGADTSTVNWWVINH